MLRTGMLALAAGLLVLRFLPALPPWWLWSLLLLGGGGCLALRRYRPALFLLGLGLLLGQVLAGIVHPTALEALFVSAILIVGGINVAVVATGAAFDLVHLSPPTSSLN